ncbi:MAG: hypothetical protein RL685_7710 [Pseudomonadota bacterium]|jgi:hypothetical protein
MTSLEPVVCYRALLTRDARFDGRLFVGVTSTGVYCRPTCPARTPRQENCRFFPSAAGAQEAGFRPCLRCRPEAAPEHAAWRGTSNTVARALERIAQGALDGEASVEQGRLTLAVDAAGQLCLLGWLDGHERMTRALRGLASGATSTLRRVVDPGGLSSALRSPATAEGSSASAGR